MIEIILVIAVLGMTAVLLVPRVGDALVSARLVSTVNLLAADARHARSLAITTGREVRIEFQQLSTAPHRVRAFDSQNQQITSLARELPRGITFMESGENFTFNYLGEPVRFNSNTANDTVTLEATNGRRLFLVLNIAGRIRVSDTHP